jgi:hypothetical protein
MRAAVSREANRRGLKARTRMLVEDGIEALAVQAYAAVEGSS